MNKLLVATVLFLAIFVSCEDRHNCHLVATITLDESEVTLTEGDEIILTAILKPDNLDNNGVTWLSSAPSVAMVDGGKVVAISEGEATIYAIANNGGQMAICMVTVKTSKVMTFTTQSAGRIIIGFGGTGKMTIDWGNGNPVETHTLSPGYKYYFSDQLTASSHTITVTGGNITAVGCSNNRFTGLDVSKNTALELLVCSNNLLTSLDISKNTELQYLKGQDNLLANFHLGKNLKLAEIYLSNNKLTESALNSIFTALPTVFDYHELSAFVICDNPGTDTCDTSIAINKGWRVNTCLY